MALKRAGIAWLNNTHIMIQTNVPYKLALPKHFDTFTQHNQPLPLYLKNNHNNKTYLSNIGIIEYDPCIMRIILTLQFNNNTKINTPQIHITPMIFSILEKNPNAIIPTDKYDIDERPINHPTTLSSYTNTTLNTSSY